MFTKKNTLMLSLLLSLGFSSLSIAQKKSDVVMEGSMVDPSLSMIQVSGIGKYKNYSNKLPEGVVIFDKPNKGKKYRKVSLTYSVDFSNIANREGKQQNKYKNIPSSPVEIKIRYQRKFSADKLSGFININFPRFIKNNYFLSTFDINAIGDDGKIIATKKIDLHSPSAHEELSFISDPNRSLDSMIIPVSSLGFNLHDIAEFSFGFHCDEYELVLLNKNDKKSYRAPKIKFNSNSMKFIMDFSDQDSSHFIVKGSNGNKKRTLGFFIKNNSQIRPLFANRKISFFNKFPKSAKNKMNSFRDQLSHLNDQEFFEYFGYKNSFFINNQINIPLFESEHLKRIKGNNVDRFSTEFTFLEFHKGIHFMLTNSSFNGFYNEEKESLSDGNNIVTFKVGFNIEAEQKESIFIPEQVSTALQNTEDSTLKTQVNSCSRELELAKTLLDKGQEANRKITMYSSENSDDIKSVSAPELIASLRLLSNDELIRNYKSFGVNDCYQYYWFNNPSVFNGINEQIDQ